MMKTHPPRRLPVRHLAGLLLGLAALALPARAAVNLNAWTSAPWNASTGVSSFSGAATDPVDNTTATFTFAAPSTGVDVSTPSAPDFGPSAASTFGFESTGFGVGDLTTGRFTRGESFSLSATQAFRLNEIDWREFTGDEVLHLAWIRNGVPQTAVLDVTATPQSFPSVVADANTAVVITNVSPAGAHLSGRLRVNTVNVSLDAAAILSDGPPVTIGGWTSSPWNSSSGVTSFSAPVTDGDGTTGTVTFHEPFIGVDVSTPATPDFAGATASTFGFESTGFGVGDTTTGRFTRGESFSVSSSRAFRLGEIKWREFTGDEVLHLGWEHGGAYQDLVFNVTANPSVLPPIVADPGTPVVITNVSPSGAHLTGRLRVENVTLAFAGGTPALDPVAGTLLILNNWRSSPWNATGGDPAFSAILTSPENGGTNVLLTFKDARTGVDVATPAAPDFTGSVASHFGFEPTGFGVGGTTTGRFTRGQSFSLEATHDLQIEEIHFREWTGDEIIHLAWTAGGVARSDVLPVTASRFAFAELRADAGTPIIFTNVSPATANLSGRLRFETIFASLVFPVTPTYDPSGPDGFLPMYGVNLAGPEFTNSAKTNIPGTYGIDYIYPSEAAFDYYASKNQYLIRLPFRWERVQRIPGGALDTAEIGRIDNMMAYAAARGMKIVLDMHNYSRYRLNGTYHVLGSTAVSFAHFQDIWSKLATRYKDSPALYGYGLMNEPTSTNNHWPAAAQAGTDAIRQVDPNGWIIVGGTDHSSASSWPSSNPDLDVQDPQGKVIYEAHCYFANANNDQYNSYDAENGYPAMGIVKVAPFIRWLQERNARGFIGEFGVPGNDARWNVVLDEFLAHLHAHGISATYWAGGPWWGGYALSVEPTNNYTVDKPQMSVLQNYE